MQKFFPTIKAVLPHRKKKAYLTFCHVYNKKTKHYSVSAVLKHRLT